MNETLINLSQKNRAKAMGRVRGRGKKIRCTVVNKAMPQQYEQPGPSQQCDNLAKSQNDESIDEEEDDGTTCKFAKFTGQN